MKLKMYKKNLSIT